MTRVRPRDGLGAPRAVLALATLVSAALLPWSAAALLALASSVFEPLLPLSAGLFADVLYYEPRAGALPLFTLGGAVATVLAYIVRDQLRAGTIGE